MKNRHLLTTALLASLALPALAEDVQQEPQEQQDLVIVNGEANGKVILRINGEEIELNGDERQFELDLPGEVLKAQQAMKLVEATYLGVAAEPMTEEAAKASGMEQATGLRLNFVKEDSPAAKAGLLQGDVMLKLNDQILINAEQLAVLIRSFEQGDNIALHVLRNGEPLKIEATLGKDMVPPIGPGGASLDRRGWRVQEGLPQGAFGGALVLPGGDLDLVPLEGGAIDLEQMLKQLQLNQNQQMQQLRQRLDLDLKDLQDKVNGGVAMQSSVTKSDGEHTIILKTDGGAKHLTVKDKQGNVLYEGTLPKEDIQTHLIEDHKLPQDVFQKVEPMLKGNLFKMEIQGLEQPEAAPKAEPGANRA